MAAWGGVATMRYPIHDGRDYRTGDGDEQGWLGQPKRMPMWKEIPAASFPATGQSAKRTLPTTASEVGSIAMESCFRGHDRCTWETSHAPPSVLGVIATGSVRPTVARPASSTLCAVAGTSVSAIGVVVAASEEARR